MTAKKQLLSFHGDAKIKEKYLKRLKQHGKMDEIVQGATGPKKGCAVWCTLDKYDHRSYETELGIPMIIAKLEDRIFERLPIEESKKFPVDFLEAIPVGKNLEPVWRKFFIWLLIDKNDGVIRFAKTEKTKNIIQSIASAFNDSLTKVVSVETWNELRKAAADATAADAAYADAAYAYAAAAAYAYAAYADAYAYAAYAYADAAYAYAAAARKKYYIKMSKKLIQLLKEA